MSKKKISYKKDICIFFLVFVLLNIIFYFNYINDGTLDKLIERIFFDWIGRYFYFITIIFPWVVTFAVKLTLFKYNKYTLSLILKLTSVFVMIFSIDLFLFYAFFVVGL